MVEDMTVETLHGAELEDKSIEDLLNEALSSVEEARRITDKLHKAGVNPPILLW